MAKLWKGRFSKELDSRVNDFNSSVSFDSAMYREDITGSIAHVSMLGRQGIIAADDAKKIASELAAILDDIDEGRLTIDPEAEDIHMFVEEELTKRLGSTGKKLHTARSRNDQVAVDLRMYLRKRIDEICGMLRKLIETLVAIAEKNLETVMPGYTHLQRAQPITLAHHMMAYVEMFKRDMTRMFNCFELMNFSPLGCGALATTTYPIDRDFTAKMLGFDAPCANSLDGVSDRDYCVEFCAAAALTMTHLSRLSEEIVLWCSWEFKFVELDDAYATGSSIMPQKKNPDICELIRGKTGRAVGDLTTLLTMLKGLPLAYNKDMQEDKEAVFDSVDTLKQCLSIIVPMLATAKFLPENMLAAGKRGFINATDCADYLVKKGMPFRDAYGVVGRLVALCVERGVTLDALPLEDYRKESELFDKDVYEAIDLITCVKGRNVIGGPAPQAVKKHIEQIKNTVLKPIEEQ